jgi:glycosyltransferase involved in cell wall biosynthesis
MKQILKIVQTPVRFYPEIGGVENHVYYLAKELVKKGISVEVICAGDTQLKPEKEGIKITRLTSPFKITNTNITLSLPFTLLKSDFDIIHTHMPTPWTADWSVLIAKLKKKKSIITIHNDIQKLLIFILIQYFCSHLLWLIKLSL